MTQLATSSLLGGCTDFPPDESSLLELSSLELEEELESD